MKGKVKFFNKIKGFGFIQGDDGKEYFVHQSAVSQGVFLRENDAVTFDPVESERGPQAQNVQPAEAGDEEAPVEDEDQAEEESPAEEEEPAEEESSAEEEPADEESEETEE